MPETIATPMTEYTNYGGEGNCHFILAVYDMVGYQEMVIPITVPEPVIG